MILLDSVDGGVFGWGSTEKFQLGVIYEENLKRPKAVQYEP